MGPSARRCLPCHWRRLGRCGTVAPVPLTETQRAALRHRPQPLVQPDLGLAVLFSAKAGCTFAVKWFFQQVGLLDAALAHSSWVHDYRIARFYMADSHRPEALLEPGMKVIKFVRNPYERTVSSYIHAVRTGYDDSRLQDFLGRPVDEQHRFSFREFVAYLEGDSLSAQRCDPHHKQQVHQLERLGLVPALRILRVEEARHRLARLERQLGLRPTRYDELRHSSHHTLRAAQAVPCADRRDWPAAVGRRRVQFPATHFFYDPSLLARVGALYRGDFQAYGYDPSQVPRAEELWPRLRGLRSYWAARFYRVRRSW